MKVISYDDFLLVERHIGPGFDILLEKNLTNEIDKKIKFGIVIPTHKISDGGAQKGREKYMNTPGLLKDSLGSIKDQKYDNYVVYLVGDAYDNDDEIKTVMDEIIPKGKLKYHNLSSPGERNKGFTKEQFRYTAGCGAMNKGLQMAKDDGCDYIVRIDHDDKWTPNHLELLAKAYTQYPDLAYVFTRSRKKVDAMNSSKKYMYQPRKERHTTTIEPNNLGFTYGEVSHSAVSWRPSMLGDIRYRDANQQSKSEPKIPMTKTIPADADMFKRMMTIIKDKGHKYMYIPKLTSFYRNRKGKF
jgi:glycosyltransferase involved in cell wall biosynthesis